MSILETIFPMANGFASDHPATRRIRRSLVTLTACLICLFGAMPASAETTSLVDVGTGGILPACPPGQQFCYSVLPAITPDARYIAFQSTVPNLVPGQPSSAVQLYLHDRQSCTTTRLSETVGGQPANSSVGYASISADGMIVAFDSEATNLVSGVSGHQVYAYDRTTSSFEVISQSDAAVPGNDLSGATSISDDGRWVAFVSLASNLVADDTNGLRDVFLYDRDLHTIQAISRSPAGVLGDDQSNRPHISGNGRFITFDSMASNLDPAPTNGTFQAYLLDRDTDGNGTFDEIGNTSLVRVSVNNGGDSADDAATWAVATDDGLKVAFASEATNLVAGDSNGKMDVFVRDLASGQTTRESVGPGGAQTTAGTYFPLRFSADGRYLTFHSGAAELADGLNGLTQVYRRDLSTGENVVVSRSVDGEIADGTSEVGIISADGQTVFFDSMAGNLIPGGIPGDGGVARVHIYARDFLPRIDPCGITPNPWNDIVIPINDGNPFNVTATATTFTVPVPDNGEIVIGFSFEGTLYIDPLAFPGSPGQTQLTITDPELATYVVGGQPPPATPWDFQSATGTVNVTYRHGLGGDEWDGDGLPDFALPDAPSGGSWQFAFKRVGGFPSTSKWSDVSIILHTVAPPTIDIQPETLSVTTIPGGSEARALSIANPGGMDLDWEVRTATSDCALPGWIDVDPVSGTLPPGDLQISTVTFDATGMGLGVHEANLCIGSNDAAHPLVTVPLTLTVEPPPAPALAFDPTTLDFGSVDVGTTSPAQSAILLNTGDAVATGIVFQAPGSGFSITSSTCGSSLAAGASCESMITFTPATSGPVAAIWHASSNEGAMADLALAGTGTEVILQFDPSALDFGDVAVGTTSAPQSASLQNIGTGNATGLAFSDPDSGFSMDAGACGNSLAAGASCVVSVTFTPTTSGTAQASIQATSDQGASTDLALSGMGTAPVLQFDPTSLDFGDVAVGTTSAPQSVSLQNIGTGNATGLAFSDPDSGFSADTSACGSSLDAGASCAVSVTFTPSDEGAANASIQVTSDQGSAVDLGLTANGFIDDVVFRNGFE
jgi:Tol biopolymer transport system component